MKPVKLNIQTLGSINNNNHFTERVVLNSGCISTIREAISEIGVVRRSVSYDIKKDGPRITYYLTFEDKTLISVHKKIWEIFDMLPINLEANRKEEGKA